ncbi:unnamed protein product [Paramecium octaurelia]|uniref:Mitochondrial pyruvate carrier n=1 Tax=Paramecium octaurelia TaxID=43137 RepID=A0A8S1VIZ9_PAROT|nr:unnamed protein product [Paramecium octaurelia]
MFGIVPKLQQYICAWNFWPAFMKKFMMSEKGPFTIFFWTPLAKWGISIANIGDMRKPVEQVNTLQQCVITLTGLLFTRWCFIIRPRVYNLVLCNFCMAQTGIYQLYRKHSQGKLFTR